MDDPISHFQKEIDILNQTRSEKGVRKISDKSPSMYLGYFPLKAILDKLHIKKYVDYFKLTHDFQFDLYELISSLIYARAVNPYSKYRTFHEVPPNLFETVHYSYDQLMDGLSFIGNDYEKFIEIFTVQVNKFFGLNTSKTYFDCTNFYFEIDREDDFRRKGSSKENKKDPIVFHYEVEHEGNRCMVKLREKGFLLIILLLPPKNDTRFIGWWKKLRH